MKTIPMYYKMPVAALRKGLKSKYPKGTTTAQLINDGHRNATTRTPFAKVGEEFKIQGCDGIFVVTEIRAVDLDDPDSAFQWALSEGWDVRYVKRHLGSQVFNGAKQTVFERVDL
jgi:hypothetical protein